MSKVKCWMKGIVSLSSIFVSVAFFITIMVFVFSTKLCVADSRIDESLLESKSIEWGGSGLLGYGDRNNVSVFSLLPRAGKFFAKNAEAEVELPLTYIRTPDTEVAAFGANINALYHLNTGTPFIPFVLGGVGALYVAGEISEVTSLVVLSQVGAGIKYFFSKSAALRVEYRVRHFSDPFVDDAGIDSNNILFGISIFR